MQAERGGQPGVRFDLHFSYEAHVFGDASLGSDIAVAVGDLVTQAGAHPGFFHCPGHRVQRALNGIRAGVVIDEGGGAVSDGVCQANQCAVVTIL